MYSREKFCTLVMKQHLMDEINGVLMMGFPEMSYILVVQKMFYQKKLKILTLLLGAAPTIDIYAFLVNQISVRFCINKNLISIHFKIMKILISKHSLLINCEQKAKHKTKTQRKTYIKNNSQPTFLFFPSFYQTEWVIELRKLFK